MRKTLVLLVAAPIILGSCTTQSGSTKVDGHDAFNACKHFVSERLKAPSTASYRNWYQKDGEITVTGSGNGPYTIVSTVDSENSFGAKVRASFTCTVTYEQDRDVWTSGDVNVLES